MSNTTLLQPPSNGGAPSEKPYRVEIKDALNYMQRAAMLATTTLNLTSGESKDLQLHLIKEMETFLQKASAAALLSSLYLEKPEMFTGASMKGVH